MASQGLRPAQIRVGMARRFGLSEAEMPTLRQVQWFISHYTKKTLHRNDDHDEILDQIEQLAYGPEVSDTSPFSLGGNVTSRLLLNAARDPALFVFHMNATFKLNHVAYLAIRLEGLYVRPLKEVTPARKSGFCRLVWIFVAFLLTRRVPFWMTNGEIKKYRPCKRRKVERAYIEAEAKED
ncbi:hypothetical protein GQ600_1431 [Phytophthora cactorum]|nr:hypothetical protein GQ600_1431 [Phytophthora cactorum]